MQVLKVIRQFNGTYNNITILKDNNDKVKAIINGYLKQPKKNAKTIVVRGIEYILDWGV